MTKIFEIKDENGNNILVEGEITSADFMDIDAVDEVTVTVNGQRKEDFGESWNGLVKYSEEDFFFSALAAYVNNDMTAEFIYVCQEVQDFKSSFQSFEKIDGADVPKFYLKPQGYRGSKLELQAISKSNRYYYGDETCVCTYADGSRATDIEAFVTGALIKDAEAGNLVYANEITRKWLLEKYEIPKELLPT